MTKASDEFDRQVIKAMQPLKSYDPARLFDNVDLMNASNEVGAERRRREAVVASAAEHSLRAATESIAIVLGELEVFQRSLKTDEEVALCVIGGPAGVSFFPESILAEDPDKIIFRGKDQEQRPFVVIQHVSQLNFAMTAARVAPEQRPRRIGFHHPEEE